MFPFGPQPKIKKKTLAVISQDEVLNQHCSKIDERQKLIQVQIEFAKKSIENYSKAIMEQNKPNWDVVKERLKELNVLPDNYNEQQFNIEFDKEEDCIQLIWEDLS